MEKFLQQKSFKLDDILRETGKFGSYQTFIYFLFAFVILVLGTSGIGFVFTVGSVDHRCKINECESDLNETILSPDWLVHAIPFENNKPKSCERFEYKNTTKENCSKNNFNNELKFKCNQWIYSNYENTIVNEFNLVCENKWKQPLVGTFRNIGQLINLLISGYFSDRYGRRAIIIFSALLTGFYGIIKSFVTSYIPFISLEFLEALMCNGLQNAVYILGVEILSPENRAFGSIITLSLMSTGNALLGLSAWYFKDWRMILRANYSLLIGAILYFWYLPESLRWLLVNKKYNEAAKQLIISAKWNKIKLSKDMNYVLHSLPENITLTDKITDDKNQIKNKHFFKNIFAYPTFCLRIIICAFCWFSANFIFLGLSLQSVTIGGNKFFDFILINLMEIPGNLLSFWGSQRFGRKIILIITIFISGFILLISTQISNIYWIQLILYLIGKLSITIAFATIFLITSELFPTNLRQLLFGFCATVSRFGSILATQIPALEAIHEQLPKFLFSGLAIMAGILAFALPETKNIQLPDTIEETLEIGKEKSSTGE